MLTYRSAQHSDAEHVALLHAESWRRTYRGIMPDYFLDGEVLENRRAVWRERLASDRIDQLVVLALEGERLVGFICAYGYEDATWGSFIDNLHVTPAEKRNGTGTGLMREAGRWFCDHYPDAGVYLWVMEANTPARRFYEKLGARHEGTIDKANPTGGSARSCRYVWPHPRALCRVERVEE